MSRRYFGTDGIRGRVGEPPVTADFMLKLGWAAGRVLGRGTHDRILIGKDTRISGYMFESALEAGLSAAGVDIHLLGPMPTPGIAYLTRTLRAAAGIVISASHNPHYDNGIKFFSAEGYKLDDDAEAAIEAMLDEPLSTVESQALGKAFKLQDGEGRYIEFCKRAFPSHLSLRGLKLVVDAANGAGYQVAPAVFTELGAEVIPLGNQPDGVNINVDCGALHPEAMREAVLAQGADGGIALDGDGDRLIMVDGRGEVVDGDELLYVIARGRYERQMLRGPVVGTLMSNLGLELALRELDVPLVRARVGDRYVLEALREHDGELGGESSGHIVSLDKQTTGDGIVSALQVLEVMVESGVGLADAVSGMQKTPQHMINVAMARGTRIDDMPEVASAVSEVEAELGADGRVLLRPSGTEPVVRVMVEGVDRDRVVRLAEQLASRVETALAAAAGA
ncbi:phosphoglucosamine mutase [Ectothiorhodospiraceae bacterium WFHF3C12]|nr:phosphoglucosamine mutase [Ectothiorhodospiraceae bacterium WFHF3C12]